VTRRVLAALALAVLVLGVLVPLGAQRWEGLIQLYRQWWGLEGLPADRLAILTRKILHVPLYAGLTLGLAWILGPSPTRARRVLLMSGTLAVLDEVAQALVPGRTGRVADVALDLLGVGLATLLLVRRDRPRPRGA
jgi:VanZ family protein